MSVCECPHCGQAYRPTAGHCTGGPFGGCCSSFAAGSDFDAHRIGDASKGQRRCLSVQERLDAGWTTDTPPPTPGSSVPTVFWVSPRTQSSRARMAARVADLRGRPAVIP